MVKRMEGHFLFIYSLGMHSTRVSKSQGMGGASMHKVLLGVPMLQNRRARARLECKGRDLYKTYFKGLKDSLIQRIKERWLKVIQTLQS